MLAVEPEIIAQYVATGRVQLAFRPVLNHGDRSVVASEAAFCALEQDQFWPMHELLFTRQDELWANDPADYPTLLGGYAGELGLDTVTFDGCMARDEARALVVDLDAEQRTRGIRAQPTFIIGDQTVVGFQSFEVFQRIIEATP